MSQQYYPPPPSDPSPQQFAPPPQQHQTPPPGQQFAPPPQQHQTPPPGQQFAPPPQQHQTPPPGQQFAPPPQQYPPPPPQQQKSYHAPPQAARQPAAHSTTAQPISGQWPREGPAKVHYMIDHRDCNTLLTLQMLDPAGATIVKAKPGAMVGMSHTIILEGAIKFSFKKMISNSEMSESSYRGKGEIMLAPAALGDIVPIRITGDQTWNVGKDAFLASTEGIKKDTKTQGLGKAFFSGEGLFVYKFRADEATKKEGGILWVTSLGAISMKELKAGEHYFIDNNHLVAWDMKYTIERVASGGLLSGMAASEGVACRFTGPGKVFFQTRNPVAFSQWLSAHAVQAGA